MLIELLYFDDCPNWTLARDRLTQALKGLDDADVSIELLQITSEDQAQTERFAGSPTIRIDGADPFAHESPQYGLACRLYATPDGVDGAPSLEQLVEVLKPAR
ncbi:MAG: thioredoxin family protein [Actinomycetales bacterium]|nr:thioredoxin family protein [Actinomycetales bacterium]